MDDDQQHRLSQLDDRISSLQNALLALPRPYDPRRASHVQLLAIARGERYILSKQRDDLEQAILGYT